jgi:hypothetical protein
MKQSDISEDILVYFSDELQLDETPAAARKRYILQKKIIQFAKDRRAGVKFGTFTSELEDQVSPDFLLEDSDFKPEWLDIIK